MPLTIIANTPLIAEGRLTVVSGFDDRHRRGRRPWRRFGRPSLGDGGYGP